MYERFDQPQALGSGIILQPTGLAVLEALGLRKAIMSLGHVINTMTGHSMPSHKRVLNVDYSALGEGLHGLAVHRAALFEVLYARVMQLGIPVRTNTEIVNLDYSDKGISLVDMRQQSHGPVDLCIDASGANSALHGHAQTAPKRRLLKYGAIWGSLDWPDSVFRNHVLDQRYVAAHTMIGVLPIGRHASVDCDQTAFFWSMPGADYSRWKEQGLDHWKNQVRSIWPETEALLDQIVSAEQMTLARYGHHTLARPYGTQLAFIGDAAHSTSPQLGQGANMGLLDAWAIGRAVNQADSVEQAVRGYADMRKRHVRLFQLASLSLTSFYQSDSRMLAHLRDAMFDPVSRLPIARRLVAGLVTGLLTRPLERIGLSTDSLHKR